MDWKLCLQIFIFGLFLEQSHGANCNATSDISELTLNKFVHAFKALVIKFDVAYPYGEKHDEFCRFAEEAAKVNNVFLGEVGMKDYGERENMGFATKYGIAGRDPVIVVIYKSYEGDIVHEKFDEPWTVENMRAFTYEHGRVFIPRPGCIHVFDILALKFMNLSDRETREVVLKEAKKETQSKSTSGKYYIKIMEKLLTEQDSFVQSEANRLNKILGSNNKISAEKKKIIVQRLNILRSFNVASQDKEEL
uniref:Endoplasmic reticulum protein ERp29 n=1 Tax=Caligus clemensi TaxID=344056 RepID=C1C0C6_CALCM|nr:Endoplasmic reticulum protein ERp29 precursor [Caligus clemensi]